MSDVQNEVQPLSLLEQLKLQHKQFIQQRDIAQNNFNQLIGAIYACEMMIQKHESEEAKKVLSDVNLGGQGNGETNEQTEEQAP
jgi:hypothetical protein